MALSVLLVDDHPIVRSGIRQLLESSADFTVDYECGNGAEALRLGDKSFDIAIIDFALPDTTAPELIKSLKVSRPDAKYIVVSMYDTNPYVAQCLDVGISAYLSKRKVADELLNAMQGIEEDQDYFSSDVLKNISLTNRALDNTGFKELTPREREIFMLLATGIGIKGASKVLDVAVKTIHSHRTNLLAKLGMTTDFDLVRFALKHKLISIQNLIP
jgi:two-component system, NarL family, response regulator FusR